MFPLDLDIPAGRNAAMRAALDMAERGRPRTAPNPCVGAVLVDRRGSIVARGFHTAHGQPHAEVECLRDAAAKGLDPRHAAMVVTLEPCAHHGKTPPCVEAILRAGVPRVLIGHADDTPPAKGGAAILRQQGVDARFLADCEPDADTPAVLQRAEDMLADFRCFSGTDQPYVTLKLAATLDGRIATRTGHSRWITSPEARREVHRMRRAMDAVLVGGETLRADDPQLTWRMDAPPTPCASRAIDGDHAEDARQPLAVVATRRIPESAEAFRLLRERPMQTIFLTSETAATSPAGERLAATGVRFFPIPEGAAGLRVGLARLRSEAAVRYVLCEGGGTLGLALLEAGLVHELHLHLAPKLLADAEARPLMQGRRPAVMDEALSLRLTETRRAGEDILLTFRPSRRT